MYRTKSAIRKYIMTQDVLPHLTPLESVSAILKFNNADSSTMWMSQDEARWGCGPEENGVAEAVAFFKAAGLGDVDESENNQ